MNQEIIVDTSALIAFFVGSETHHQAAQCRCAEVKSHAFKSQKYFGLRLSAFVNWWVIFVALTPRQSRLLIVLIDSTGIAIVDFVDSNYQWLFGLRD